MTRPTWDGIEPIPDGPPKNFDELVEDYQRDHYPRLWEALEDGEYYGSPWPTGAGEIEEEIHDTTAD